MSEIFWWSSSKRLFINVKDMLVVQHVKNALAKLNRGEYLDAGNEPLMPASEALLREALEAQIAKLETLQADALAEGLGDSQEG